jgi:hypothetical protein
VMGCHLIQDESESCVACAAFERGEKLFDLSGETNHPLCNRHFNAVLDKVI